MRLNHRLTWAHRALLCALLSLTPCAHASWTMAEATHVVVFGEADAQALRQRVRTLERFHALLEYIIPGDTDVARPRHTLFLVHDAAGFQRALPASNAFTTASYATTIDGSVALALTRNAHFEEDDDALMRQFALHFMRERTRVPLPSWAVIGLSQYFSTVEVDGERVAIGKASNRHEADVELTWISMARLLTADPLLLRLDEQAPYRGQSWLLIHYLFHDAARWTAAHGLFTALRAGVPAENAVQQSLGMSLGRLRQELERYALRGLKYTLFDLPLPEPVITTTALPPSADALLLDSVGLAFAQIEPAAVARLQAGATRFSGDTFALELAARADVAAGEGRSALARIAPLLGDGATPQHNYIAATAYLALAHSATSPDEQEEAFVTAGNLLARVIRADERSYSALYRYYKVRTRREPVPDAALQDVLVRAYELSPRTPQIAIELGVMLLRVERLQEARTVLEFLASDPLAEAQRTTAKRLLELIAHLAPGQRPTTAELDAATSALGSATGIDMSTSISNGACVKCAE